MIGWIIFGVVMGLIVLFVIWLIGTYNSLIRRRASVDEAFSAMDVCLKKRYDLIPNLVNTVKGYAKHESETLEAVIKARKLAMGASSDKEKAEAENMLTGTLKSLFKVTEAYPDLKANANFMSLQNKLSEIETEISNSRRYYNACVRSYNVKIQTIPSNIVAKWFKFEERTMFEVDAPEERKNVKVEF